MKLKPTLFLLVLSFFGYTQDLTISRTSETGVSGTNCTTSVTKPVTISSIGTVNIDRSVIQGYLNNDQNVLVQIFMEPQISRRTPTH